MVEGRTRIAPGTVDEATEAWALIGVLTVAWWAARKAARLARRAARR